MDPITTAIVAALGAGALSGLSDASKTAISDAYARLKALLTKKFGTGSELVRAVSELEANPEADGRQTIVQEEMVASGAARDEELLAAANALHLLLQAQQAGRGKFTIQNNAPVQGQTIGDHATITQQFGPLP